MLFLINHPFSNSGLYPLSNQLMEVFLIILISDWAICRAKIVNGWNWKRFSGLYSVLLPHSDQLLYLFFIILIGNWAMCRVIFVNGWNVKRFSGLYCYHIPTSSWKCLWEEGEPNTLGRYSTGHLGHVVIRIGHFQTHFTQYLSRFRVFFTNEEILTGTIRIFFQFTFILYIYFRILSNFN